MWLLAAAKRPRKGREKAAKFIYIHHKLGVIMHVIDAIEND